MVNSFGLDPGFAGPADQVAGRIPAGEAAPVRSGFHPFCLKDHLKKFAFRYVAVHMQIRAENRFWKRFDRILLIRAGNVLATIIFEEIRSFQ
jgi:hypothetical protein